MTSSVRAFALSIAPGIRAASLDLRRSTYPIAGDVDGKPASERRLNALDSLDALAAEVEQAGRGDTFGGGGR